MKNFYVTTPIYYVNASPHLGHAYTTIVADVIARYQHLVGNHTFFLTGTDEHGTNIAQAAEDEGIDVREFVDRNSQRFRDLIPLIDATPDFFIRTTDADHVARVQQVLTRLYERGDIYEGVYSGHYCAPCEAYYAEGELLDGSLCPTHKRPTTILEEKNWFFRLSAYQERLEQLYAQRPDFVRPTSRFNEALSFIRGGLNDLSISRSSISWGVPLPWDPGQVAYVWIDALFNYYTGLGYGAESDQTQQFWPPNLQILAKDILKFHAVIWPALLMAAELELPQQLYIHGYLLMGGDKMSKTTGNVFDPFPVIERHGADPVRFYVLREVQFGQDGTVSQESFEARYTSELANDLGNLVSRTASMATKYLDPAQCPAAPGDSAIAQATTTMLGEWRTRMDSYDLSGALDAVWDLVRVLNRHVEERAPWKLARDAEMASQLHDTLAELIEGVSAVAYALSPVMPNAAASIMQTFGRTSQQSATQESATQGSAALGSAVHAGIDYEWGQMTGCTVTVPEPLFPRLEMPAESATTSGER